MFRFFLGVAVGAGLALTAHGLYSSCMKKEQKKQDEEVTGLGLEEEVKTEKIAQDKVNQETQWEEMDMMDDEDEWFDATSENFS